MLFFQWFELRVLVSCQPACFEFEKYAEYKFGNAIMEMKNE